MINAFLEHVAERWRSERPEIDASPVPMVGRIGWTSKFLNRILDRLYESKGINGGEFDVLTILRMQGEPYALSPGALAKTTMLSSAAMTNRLDRLEQAGWVVRSPDPTDRRALVVTLTPSGFELTDSTLTEYVGVFQQALSVLSPKELAALERTMTKLLDHVEEMDGTGVAPVPPKDPASYR